MVTVLRLQFNLKQPYRHPIPEKDYTETTIIMTRIIESTTTTEKSQQYTEHLDYATSWPFIYSLTFLPTPTPNNSLQGTKKDLYLSHEHTWPINQT